MNTLKRIGIGIAGLVLLVTLNLGVAHADEAVGTPVLHDPEFCTDVTGDGVVSIADVVTVVKGFGTDYFTTDIGAVVADWGRVGYCL